MGTFTIDTDNNIQAYAEAPASSNPAEVFSTQKELAKLAGAWPAARLIEIWNSFAGVAPFDELKPVKKFTSRKGAVARIWKAIERLSPDVAQPAEPVAPTKGRAKKSPTKAKRRDTARPGAKRTANVAREGSKKAEVLDLMRRSKGATLAEIMKLTNPRAPGTTRANRDDRRESALLCQRSHDGSVRRRARVFTPQSPFMRQFPTFRISLVRTSDHRRRVLLPGL